jgi:hypothetical protein
VTGEELRAKYPSVPSWDTAAALRLVGSTVPINFAYASLYPSREAAEEFAASNLEHHGHPSLGIAELPDGSGWVGVLDLRPSLGAAQRAKDSA